MKYIFSYFLILFLSSFCVSNGNDKISETLSFPVDNFLEDLYCLEESYSLAIEAYRNDSFHTDEIVDSSYKKNLIF